MRLIRIGILLAALVGIIWFTPAITRPLDQAWVSVADRFDKRPTRTLLFIGNSRTFYHDMPFMLRKMADSAGTPERYAITVKAWSGASLEENWADADVQRLLTQPWSNVIIQAESRAQYDPALRPAFFTYGRKLVAAAQQTRSDPLVIVNWVYGDTMFAGFPSYLRSGYYRAIQNDYRTLEDATGARLVNTGQAWELLLSKHPAFALYEDGNHPTIHGSYFSALMLYTALAGSNGGEVTYIPQGITPEEAALMKSVVREYRTTVSVL